MYSETGLAEVKQSRTYEVVEYGYEMNKLSLCVCMGTASMLLGKSQSDWGNMSKRLDFHEGSRNGD